MKDCVNTAKTPSIRYLFIRRSWCVDCVWKIYWRVTKMDHIQRKGLLLWCRVLFSWPLLLQKETACGAMGLLSSYSLSSVVTSRMQSLCPILSSLFFSPLSQYFEGVSVVSVLSLCTSPTNAHWWIILLRLRVVECLSGIATTVWVYKAEATTTERKKEQKRNVLQSKLNKHEDWKADDEKQSKYTQLLLCLCCDLWVDKRGGKRTCTHWRKDETLRTSRCYSQKLLSQNDANLFQNLEEEKLYECFFLILSNKKIKGYACANAPVSCQVENFYAILFLYLLDFE